jgi:hypothetical protein
MASQTATYGFQRGQGEANIYIGGAASDFLKADLKMALNDLNLAVKARISSKNDNSQFQGFSSDNLIDRLSTRGIHLEQSAQARNYHLDIARAVAEAFVCRLRFLLCIYIGDLERKRIKREATFIHGLSRGLTSAPLNVENAIEEYKVWKAADDVLGARIKIVEKIEETFAEATAKDLRCT